jgi:hypothetical protein
MKPPRPSRALRVPLLAATIGVVGCTAGTITGQGDDELVAGRGAVEGGHAGAATAGQSAGRGGASLAMGGAGGQGATGGDAAPGNGGAGGANVGGSGGSGSAPDAGARSDASGGGAGTSANPDDPPAGYVPAVIGVGYGGIRVVSTDDGATWVKKAQLGAEGVAWGRGLWITGGWQFFTSPDGKNWTKRPNPNGCGLMQGCAYGNGRFVATCGDGTWISTDGMTWTKGVGSIGTGGHTNLRFGAGKFAAWGDNNTSFTSTDGISWTRLGLPDVNFCDGTFKTDSDCGGAFRAPSLWLRSEWRAKITRSTNGSTYKQVYLDDGQNSVSWFAWGWTPPN